MISNYRSHMLFLSFSFIKSGFPAFCNDNMYCVNILTYLLHMYIVNTKSDNNSYVSLHMIFVRCVMTTTTTLKLKCVKNIFYLFDDFRWSML